MLMDKVRDTKEQVWTIYVCPKCGRTLPNLRAETYHASCGPVDTNKVKVIPLTTAKEQVEAAEKKALAYMESEQHREFQLRAALEKLAKEIECHEHDYTQKQYADEALDTALERVEEAEARVDQLLAEIDRFIHTAATDDWPQAMGDLIQVADRHRAALDTDEGS